MLDADWVPLLSEAMLGQAMDGDDEGAADLMQEVAAQGFGVVQTALAEAGLQLSAVRFEATPPGQAVPSLDGTYWRVPFAANGDDTTLDGFALLPAVPEESTEANAPSSTVDAPGQSAGQPSAARGSAPAQSSQAGGDPVDVAPASFGELGKENFGGDGGGDGNFELLAEVKLEVTVELGRRRLPLADVLKLTTGSVVELEKLVGEPLSVYANGRLIAEGEAVVIDEQFGVRITNLASKSRRDKAFF